MTLAASLDQRPTPAGGPRRAGLEWLVFLADNLDAGGPWPKPPKPWPSRLPRAPREARARRVAAQSPQLGDSATLSDAKRPVHMHPLGMRQVSQLRLLIAGSGTCCPRNRKNWEALPPPGPHRPVEAFPVKASMRLCYKGLCASRSK